LLNISEAKAKLSSVIERVVSKGEEFLIGRAGKPVAKIIRYEPARRPRHLGVLKGKIKLSKDWEAWPEDLARSLGIKA
jgi:prevent-host-death family protein